jgi:dihydroorotate dehydrogenase electron transfer subunit
MTTHPHRGTIRLEDAEIIFQRSFPGNQHILRVSAPEAAGRALPGTFAHLTCDPSIAMRRPLSIMQVDSDEGWMEFLYKPVGHGLAQLANRRPGERISMLAPIGRGFAPDPSRPKVLAIGGGVGIPPMIFLAQHLREHPIFKPLVLMGSELPYPFELQDAGLAVLGMPGSASVSLTLLESWGVPSRLASNAALPGTWRGYVTDLARLWLDTLAPRTLNEVQIAACGPEPMLRATADLARHYGLPCSLALEEFMACGVGGCAGCTIRVETADGPAMKRVCVDGPVFDAREVYPSAAASRS